MTAPTEAEVANRAAELFARAFGGAPDGVWLAPGRVNLIGEHIDYVGGRVLPFALPYRTAVAVRLRADDAVRCASTTAGEIWCGRVGDIGPGTPAGWPGYAVGPLWALIRRDALPARGVDITIDSSVPQGSGLSSSAALECAVALALAELTGLPTDDAGRRDLARDCVDAENVVAGAATGGMDQAIALRARAGHAMLLDCADSSVQHVPLDLAADGLTLLVIDTRAPHRLADGSYAARRASVEDVSARLGVESLRSAPLEQTVAGLDADTAVRMRHIVTELRRVDEVVALLRAGRAADIGPLLTASHLSLRDDYEVSSPELDCAVDAALRAGALGARMTGGGFGGSAIALVHSDDARHVTDAVEAAARASGLPIPRFLTALPEGAAHRAGRTPDETSHISVSI